MVASPPSRRGATRVLIMMRGKHHMGAVAIGVTARIAARRSLYHSRTSRRADRSHVRSCSYFCSREPSAIEPITEHRGIATILTIASVVAFRSQKSFDP
jgi:hypothetical protein